MNTITLWQVASVPFWLLGAYFVAQAGREIRPAHKGPRCIACNLIAAGIFAVVAAKVAL